MRPLIIRILIVLGAVFAALGLIAGHLNRELFDGPTFASHVDEIRRDDDVAAALGTAISTRLILANPDLVAIRPLVESVATRVAGGDLLAGPTRTAVERAHRALTEGDADSIALRIADVGAVVTGVLAAVAPERTAVADAELSVTLASIGDQAFADTTIAVARTLDVLAWLLPLLAARLLRRRHRRVASSSGATAATVGRALLWSAGGVGAGARRRRLPRPPRRRRHLGWGASPGPRGTSWCGRCGGASFCWRRSAWRRCSPATRRRRWRSPVTPPGPGKPRCDRTARPACWCALAGALVIGVAAIADPLGLIEPVIVVAGAFAVLYAVAEVARLAAASRAAHSGGFAARRHAERSTPRGTDRPRRWSDWRSSPASS